MILIFKPIGIFLLDKGIKKKQKKGIKLSKKSTTFVLYIQQTLLLHVYAKRILPVDQAFHVAL